MLFTESHRRFIELVGTGCILVSVVFLGLLFVPVLWQELRYQVLLRELAFPKGIAESFHSVESAPAESRRAIPLHPVDKMFGIVIPKIGANAKVIPQVNWQDSRVYQQALTKGVAHASGSALPGEQGNVFLFAHAGANPFEAVRYNAVFYLIDKLENGDVIEVWHNHIRYVYQVTDKKVVATDMVEYVERKALEEGLTLMTCWPAGTTWKRLIVQAELLP